MKDLLKSIPLPDGRADSWQGNSLPPKYVDIAPTSAPCWFVDGGNAEILGAPHFSLQKIRALALRLPNKQMIKREKTVLIRKATIGWEILATNEKSQFLPAPELAEAVTLARQQIEHEVALEAVKTGELVVLDGDVAPPNCVALQKTSTVLTDNNFPLSSVLLRDGPWYAQLGRTIASKLDKQQRHVFLLHNATPLQINVIASYSNDSAFPGYPWGLVLVDRLARVSHEEALSLRTHAKSMLKELSIAISHAEASTDSHKILDGMG